MRHTLDVRCRDLTPTVTDTFRDGNGTVCPAVAPGVPRVHRRRTQPWVAAGSPSGPARCTPATRLGGLFGAYAMSSGQRRSVATPSASPSIWWDDREMLRREAAYTASHDDLAATVVVTVGGHETPAGRERATTHLPAFAPPAVGVAARPRRRRRVVRRRAAPAALPEPAPPPPDARRRAPHDGPAGGGRPRPAGAVRRTRRRRARPAASDGSASWSAVARGGRMARCHPSWPSSWPARRSSSPR